MSRECMLGKWCALGLGFVFTPSSAVLLSQVALVSALCALCLDRHCCPCLGLQPCLWVQNQHLTEQILGLWGGAMLLTALGSWFISDYLPALWAMTCLGWHSSSGTSSMNVFEHFLPLLTWSSRRFAAPCVRNCCLSPLMNSSSYSTRYLLILTPQG